MRVSLADDGVPDAGVGVEGVEAGRTPAALFPAGEGEVFFFEGAENGAGGVAFACGGFGGEAVFFVPAGGAAGVLVDADLELAPVEAAGTFKGSLQAGQRISFPAY